MMDGQADRLLAALAHAAPPIRRRSVMRTGPASTPRLTPTAWLDGDGRSDLVEWLKAVREAGQYDVSGWVDRRLLAYGWLCVNFRTSRPVRGKVRLATCLASDPVDWGWPAALEKLGELLVTTAPTDATVPEVIAQGATFPVGPGTRAALRDVLLLSGCVAQPPVD